MLREREVLQVCEEMTNEEILAQRISMNYPQVQYWWTVYEETREKVPVGETAHNNVGLYIHLDLQSSTGLLWILTVVINPSRTSYEVIKLINVAGCSS